MSVYTHPEPFDAIQDARSEGRYSYYGVEREEPDLDEVKEQLASLRGVEVSEHRIVVPR